jgi:hypothetical protein
VESKFFKIALCALVLSTGAVNADTLQGFEVQFKGAAYTFSAIASEPGCFNVSSGSKTCYDKNGNLTRNSKRVFESQAGAGLLPTDWEGPDNGLWPNREYSNKFTARLHGKPESDGRTSHCKIGDPLTYHINGTPHAVRHAVCKIDSDYYGEAFKTDEAYVTVENRWHLGFASSQGDINMPTTSVVAAGSPQALKVLDAAQVAALKSQEELVQQATVVVPK